MSLVLFGEKFCYLHIRFSFLFAMDDIEFQVSPSKQTAKKWGDDRSSCLF